jgi:23S rRNA maturation-related 3'-5' exoribonuclease YhaM
MHSSTLILIDQAKTLGNDVYKVASELLDDSRFDIWSGSSKPEQHHYGPHGLTIHTHEIMALAFSAKGNLKLDIDPIELYLSVLFHDSGKLFDYSPVYQDVSDPRGGDEEFVTNYIDWKPNPHKRLIHHISRSALIWHDAAMIVPQIYDKYHDLVIHNILAHHGRREHGSPVMPKTKAAWLLHLCDSISARMNDCDRLDFVKIP